jgi:transmembrane sensor
VPLASRAADRIRTMTSIEPNLEQEAGDVFVERLHGDWTEQKQADLERRLASEPAFADAYLRVVESWATLDTYANVPEVIACREEAIAYVRRASRRGWSSPGKSGGSRVAAAVAGAIASVAVVWQFSPYGYQPGRYRTGVGEQRTVELEDHTRIALDASTSLRVRYSKDARLVQLTDGQAQFSVAKDLSRPFKVQVGAHTIVALGTVFTVDYVDQEVHVAMMEGKVAVVADPSESAQGKPATIELSAGEELRIDREGNRPIVSEADLEAATAWREGKVIFRAETLEQAVRRLNRYSHVRVEIKDASLATERISGVFEAGDTQGFVSAIQQYLPVAVQRNDSIIELRTTQP